MVFLTFAEALVAVPVVEAQSSSDARPAAQGVFDVVVANGRVIDRETGLDGVRLIGIRNGRIANARKERNGKTLTQITPITRISPSRGKA